MVLYRYGVLFKQEAFHLRLNFFSHQLVIVTSLTDNQWNVLTTPHITLRYKQTVTRSRGNHGRRSVTETRPKKTNQDRLCAPWIIDTLQLMTRYVWWIFGGRRLVCFEYVTQPIVHSSVPISITGLYRLALFVGRFLLYNIKRPKLVTCREHMTNCTNSFASHCIGWLGGSSDRSLVSWDPPN